MYYAKKNSLHTVSRIEEDGILETMSGSIPVKMGQFKLTDEYGNSEAISDSVLHKYYIPVQKVNKPIKKKISPFEEMYARQIAAFNGILEQDESDLHNRNIDLTSNKAL